MQVKATAKYIHMSPRKTRLVVDLIRGLSIGEARRQLLFSKKLAAKPILKTLNSAVANAVNNFGAEEEVLMIDQAFVNEGPIFHRYKPRAHGRATPIRKRMSHITIELTDGKDTQATSIQVKEEKQEEKKTIKTKVKMKSAKEKRSDTKKKIVKKSESKKLTTNKSEKKKEVKEATK